MSRYLFDHLSVLGERILQAPSVAVFLNLDGMLAPPDDLPGPAELPAPVRQTLRSVARLENVKLAVLSSRRLSDLKMQVGLPELSYAGNNGLELSSPSADFVEPAAVGLQGAIHELAVELARKLQPIAGVCIEDKGLALGVHYRQAAEDQWEEIRRLVHATLADTSHPFVLTPGEKAYDIHPRVRWNKGDAVGWLHERWGLRDPFTIYIGDNPSDEEAFAVVPEGITVRVGNVPETSAQYHVNETREVQEFLGWFANLLVEKSFAPPRPARL